jgi:hypothetical protein
MLTQPSFQYPDYFLPSDHRRDLAPVRRDVFNPI